MKLTGDQRKQLYNALLAAFPNEVSLKRLVSFELGENLTVISGSGPLGDILFNLLVWAEANDRVVDLVLGGLKHNPHNQDLSQCSISLGIRQTDSIIQDTVLPSVIQQQAKLIIKRQYMKANSRLSLFHIYIDGEKALSLKNGEEGAQDINAGIHTVEVRSFALSSQMILEFRPGQSIVLYCHPSLGGLRLERLS